MSDFIVRIEGLDHRLVPTDAPRGSWAASLVGDPLQLHVVHLLVDRLLEGTSRREWSEIEAELIATLDRRYEPLAIEAVASEACTAEAA